MDPSFDFLTAKVIPSLFSLFFMQSSSLLGVCSFGVSMQRNEIALAALQAVIWGHADSGSSLLVPVAELVRARVGSHLEHRAWPGLL